LSQAFEKGEQLVLGSISPGFSVERGDGVENLLLEIEVSIHRVVSIDS
jgi:hypothetical protein